MNRSVFALSVLASSLIAFSSAPVSAQSLLGIIGGKDSGALITIDKGSAGSSGLVNLGLGGGGGNVVDANVGGGAVKANASVGGSSGLVNANASVGGSSGLVNANVSVGGSKGLVDANVGALNNNVNVKANVGGSGGLVNVGVGIGGGGGGNGGPGTGGPGTGGPGTGGPGTGGPGTGGPGGNGGLAAVNGGASTFSDPSGCIGGNANQLLALFQGTKVSGWNTANNIQLVPIRVCPELRKQVANYLANERKYHQMVGAIQTDALIQAALSRTKYQSGHVVGIQKQGATLVVYVF